MWKSIAFGLGIFLCTGAAQAQDAPTFAPALPAAWSPPGTAAPPRVPPVFLARFLSYDEDEKLVLMGQQRRPLTREEVFREIGRPDLLERSQAMERRRLIFGVSGGAVLAIGLITAAVAKAGMPNLNKGFCVENYVNYNEVCVPDAKRREAIAATGLIAGISLGGLLGALAIGSSPNILSKDETQGLIATHNATLMQRLKSGASRPMLTPVVSWKGGGAVLSFQF